MLLQALGAVLPMAIGIAISPFPVIGVVLTVAGPRGRVTGPAFAVGWLTGLSIVAVVAVVLLGGADDADSTTSTVADVGRVLLGAVLIVGGVRTWTSRPRSGATSPEPAWMTSLNTAAPMTALKVGVLLSAANPKNIVLAAAAATSIVEAGVHDGDRVLAVAVFVLLASLSVLGVVVLGLVGGRRGAATIDSVRSFMVSNRTVITVVVMLILGAKVLGDGLAGIGR